MIPWSWLKSAWTMLSPNNLAKSDSDDEYTDITDEDDDEYFDYHPLSCIPFVFHEIEPRGELNPKARSGHRIITDSNGNIYSLGGYNPEGLRNTESPDALFKKLWKFNMSTLKWSKVKMIGQSPKLLCSFGALCIDDLLFVQGGTGVPFGQEGCNKLFICKLSNGSWKSYKLKAAHENIPPKYYGQALAFEPNELAIYSVGGTCGHTYNHGVTRIDLKSRTAELVYPYSIPDSFGPLGSYRHEIVLYDDKIYLFGGGTSTTDIGFEEIFYFDLKIKLWKTIRASADSTHGFPAARKFHGLVSLDQYAYIVGGASNGERLAVKDDLWRFNLETFEWTFIAKLPRPIYFHSASISSSGLMTIFGGVEQAPPPIHTQRTNALYTMWLRVPSLGEIAWTAFLNGYDISKIPHTRLLEIGVPPSYVKRLKD